MNTGHVSKLKYLCAHETNQLLQPDQQLSEKIFLGKVSLLHVWATWCATCRAEHLVLMDLARSKKVVFYGLNYKDNPEAAKNWLKQYGNPYKAIISDPQGRLGIDLGVYGTPETFLIDSQGVIRYKYIGAITQHIWEHDIMPEIQRYQSQP